MSCIAGLALSLHIAMSDEYNMRHPYVECVFPEAEALSYGAFINSEEDLTGFIKYTINDYIDLQVGAVVGYQGVGVAPMVRLKYKNFFAMPGVENNKIEGIVLGIEIPIIGEK